TNSSDSGVTLTIYPPPIAWHFAGGGANYIDPASTYFSTRTGTGTFTDDTAIYNGANNSSNGGGNYTGAGNPTQAVANFVAQMVGTSSGNCNSIPSAQTLATYSLLMSCYAATFSAWGVYTFNYEGNWDVQTQIGATQSGLKLTSANQNLLLAAQASTVWS